MPTCDLVFSPSSRRASTTASSATAPSPHARPPGRAHSATLCSTCHACASGPTAASRKPKSIMLCRKTQRSATAAVPGDVQDASTQGKTSPRSTGAGAAARKTLLVAAVPIRMAVASDAAAGNALMAALIRAIQDHVRRVPSPSLRNASAVPKPSQCAARRPQPRRRVSLLCINAAPLAVVFAARSWTAAAIHVRMPVIPANANLAASKWMRAATVASAPGRCAVETASPKTASTMRAQLASRAASTAMTSVGVPSIAVSTTARSPVMPVIHRGPFVLPRQVSSRRALAVRTPSHLARSAKTQSRRAAIRAQRCRSAVIRAPRSATWDLVRHAGCPCRRLVDVERQSRAELATNASRKNSRDARRCCAPPCASRCATVASISATANAVPSTSRPRASPRNDPRWPSCKLSIRPACTSARSRARSRCPVVRTSAQ